MSVARAAKAAEVSKDSIQRWYGKCRDVCTKIESALPKMKGTPSDLDEVAWRLRNKDSNTSLLEIFWRDLERVHEIKQTA